MDIAEDQHRCAHKQDQNDARPYQRKSACPSARAPVRLSVVLGRVGHWAPACQPQPGEARVSPTSSFMGSPPIVTAAREGARKMVGAGVALTSQPAGVAQLVAQTTCNRQVVGSIPTAGSSVMSRDTSNGVAEHRWPRIPANPIDGSGIAETVQECAAVTLTESDLFLHEMLQGLPVGSPSSHRSTMDQP